MNFIQSKHPPTSVPLEITEFGDFGTPQSRQARKAIDTVIKLHDGDVKHRYRHFPNPDCTDSLLAAFALEAAKRQDQFLQMYDAMITLPTINCHTLIAQALQLGFDQQQFMDDLADDNLHTIIKQDWVAGHRLSVYNTPTLFIEGYRFYGKFTLSRLLPFIHFHLIRQSRASKTDSLLVQMQVDEQRVYSLR